MKCFLASIMGLSFCLGGLVANAQVSPAPADFPDKGQPMSGRMPSGAFVTKATLDGMLEVQAGQLALSKSQNQAVKNFAQQMITDHGKANDELAAIASSKHMNVPTQLDAEHQRMLSNLSGRSGADFDSAYVSKMRKAHERAVALFTAASGADDPDIAAFAGKTLPTLKMHKQMAAALKTDDAS